jgi:selenocysteine lyase/cysteine desulfurase
MPDEPGPRPRIDVRRVRAETPGADRVLHFNNAGASLPPRPVVDAVTGHLRREARIGGYEAAAEAEDRLASTYRALARLLGCRPDEVAIASSATRAWDMAFYSLRLSRDDRILTSRASYASNYMAFLQVARRTGCEVAVVESDGTGQIDVDDLRRRIDGSTALVALTHVPTNGGLVNPAADVGRVASEAGVPYLLDACQSVGQMPVDVEVLGCDLLSATGRKFLRGPRGIGFLYVRRGLLEQLEPPFVDLRAATWTGPGTYELRDDARRFEEWERSPALQLGLGAAASYAGEIGVGAGWRRTRRLAAGLRDRLDALPGVEVRDAGRVKCGIVGFTVDGADPAAMRDALRARDVNVSVSPRTSTLLDAAHRELPDLLRASVHYYNTEEEVERFVRALREVGPAG